MEHPHIDDEKIVDRYLAGRLPAAEEERFEEHLFECTGCLEKVESGEELRRGLRAVAAEDAARATLSQGLAAVGFLAWLRGRRPGQLAGLGALALAFVLMPAALLWQRAEVGRLRGLVAQVGSAGAGLGEPTGAFVVVSLGLERDAGGDLAEIRPDAEKKTVLFSLELPVADAALYRVTLRDAAGEILWTGDDLEPNLYDTLLVALPSSYLAPGSYRFTIEGLQAAGAEPVGAMAFRVLPGQ